MAGDVTRLLAGLVADKRAVALLAGMVAGVVSDERTGEPAAAPKPRETPLW